MRADAIGIFWQDIPRGRGHNAIARVMPPIPPTTWQPLRDLPNLARATTLCVDTETFDPSLTNKFGPGWARGVGNIAGISIGADFDGRWYFPIRHTVEPETNYEPARILEWLRRELRRPEQTKVFANALYDVGWLKQEGVAVAGPLYDVQFAEALLAPTAFVALEVLARKYLEEGKVGGELFQWLADYYGGKADDGQRANIYRSPPRLAAPYAEADADLPIRILQRQWPILRQNGLLDLFELECGLIPLLVEMRFAGVSVDIVRAEVVKGELELEEKKLNAQLKQMVGFEVNVNAADSLAKAFKKLDVPFNYTKPTVNNPKGRPSFTKDFLNLVGHPVGKLVRNVRKVQKTRSTFVESYILKSHVNGKVYPSFHPLKGDENGAVTGRFASSNPNYQNLPSRDEIMGQLVRGLCIPDAGHQQWRKYDWSQLQYRFLAHYAVGDGADELRRVYNTDPKADYHALVQGQIKRVTGKHLERKPVKNVNFGFVFGMGIDHLAVMLELERAAAEELADVYHEGVPYVKATLKATAEEAQTFGCIRTFLNRRATFDLWEPKDWDDDRPALPYRQACQEYGRVRRAYTHKALNYKLQGSEGDYMKHCMLRAWKEGVFAATGVPRLIVHDEFDFSDPGGQDEAFDYLHHEIMERSLKFRVPISAGCDIGPNWGACL